MHRPLVGTEMCQGDTKQKMTERVGFILSKIKCAHSYVLK